MAPSEAHSIEQLRITVGSQEPPPAAKHFRATASDKKTH
jgi:hypothetical protein